MRHTPALLHCLSPIRFAAAVSRRAGVFLPVLLLAFALPAAAQLQIINDELPVGVVGVSYPHSVYFRLTATGGTGSYTYSILSGTAPAGLTFVSDGSFGGVPTIPGASVMTIQVTDTLNSQQAQRSLTLNVQYAPAPPQWTVRGLSGGSIYYVRTSPSYVSDQTLFMSSTFGEVYRSDNRGTDWNRFVVNPVFASDTVQALELSPVFNRLSIVTEAERTVFVSGQNSGVYKSTDHGATFLPVNAGLPCAGAPPLACNFAGALALSPNYAADGTLWVAFTDNPTASVTIYRSTDRAASWSPLSTLTGLPNGEIQQIAPSPGFAADNTLFLLAGDDRRVYKSATGGASWTLVYSSIARPKELLLSPEFASDQTIFMRDDYSQLLRSTDGGVNFIAQALPTSGFAALKRAGLPPRYFFNKYSGAGYSFYTTDDDGATFLPLPVVNLRKAVNAATHPLAVAAAPAGGVDLFSGHNKGLDASRDQGVTFAPSDRGVSAFIFRYESLSSQGDVLIGGVQDYWVKSADQGVSWVLRAPPSGAVVATAISPNYGADHTIFFGGYYLYRTIDGGATYTTALARNNITAIAVAPGYTPAGGTVFAGGYNMPLFRSQNGGVSFTEITGAGACPLTTSSGVTSIAISPNYGVDKTLFIGTYSPNQMCKSTDEGNSWSLLRLNYTAGISLSPSYLDSAPNGSNAKILLINGGSLRSTDGGASFAFTSGTTGGGNTRFSPRFNSDGTVFVEGYFGVFRSSNYGQNFFPLGLGDELGTRTVKGIYLAPQFDGNAVTGSVAVALSRSSGVWRSTDGGRTFHPILEYQFVSRSLNALAAVPGGATVPTLYAATGDQGVFQSDDGGLTFVHQSAGLPPEPDARAIIVPTQAAANPVTAIAAKGLWRLNGGAWSQVGAALLGTYASFLDDGNNLYAARRDGVSLRSPDSGVSWFPLDPGQTDLVKMDFNSASLTAAQQGMAAVSKPFNPSAVTASLWAVSLNSGPRYSLTAGGSWIAAPGSGDYPLPNGVSYSTVNVFGITPGSGRVVMVGTTTGLYLTRDGGDSWRSVSGPGSGLEGSSRNISALLSSPTSFGNTDVLAGVTGSTNGGVYLSGDGGEHWTQINQGFDPNSLNISTLVRTSCTGCPVQYYTGTYGSGVFTRTIAVNNPPAITGWCFGSTSCSCGTAAASGPQQGGQPFKLCGSNFMNLAVVEFDGLAASGCGFVSASEYTCAATPPHFAGPATLRLRNSDTRAGTAPAGAYSYTAGTPRATDLRIAKSGGNAQLTYGCGGCTSPMPLVYRSQNSAFTLNVERYTGNAGSYTNTGALAAGANPSYFWSVE